MSFLLKHSLSKIMSRLKHLKSADRRRPVSSVENSRGEVYEDLTLERIKDLLIEAYSTFDETSRMLLLEKADRLEAQLIATYRSRGLKITADNICDTLSDHRRRLGKR